MSRKGPNKHKDDKKYDMQKNADSNSDNNVKNKRSKQKNDSKKTKKQSKDYDEHDYDDDNNNDTDDSNDMPPVGSLRKADAKLDNKYQIPECYVSIMGPIFDKKIHETSNINASKFTIKVSKERIRMFTTLKWKGNLFTQQELKDLQHSIKKTFSTRCTYKEGKKESSLTISGREPKKLKAFLVDNYHFEADSIDIKDIPLEIPKKFKVEVSLDDTHDNLANVVFYYKKWDCPRFFEFAEKFEEDMHNEWNLEKVDMIDHNKKYSITFKGDNFTEIFRKYFFDECNLTPDQVKIERHLLLSKKYSLLNTYKVMKERFQGFDSSSYFKEMSKTISDTYSYERKLLSKYLIHTDLNFNYVFTDDDEYNYYSIVLNICNTFNIDGLNARQGLSEGSEVIIKHKSTKCTVVGSINSMENGNIIVLFKLKPNQIPPGCGKNDLPKGKSDEIDNFMVANFENDEEYKKKQQQYTDDDYDLFNDDDIEYDYDEPNTNYNSQNGQYLITFQPNSAIYRRSAMALLILNDIKSPIKDMIINNSGSIDESVNKISAETVTDDPIDIPGFHLIPTPSQKDCINNILQNHLSLIQGPPGCGKTTSIGFFVYHLLKRNVNEGKRILLCAYSNQAVENIVKVVFPIVKALGKKMVWIPKQSMHFETKDDFLNASEEEEYLSYYKILTGDKQECALFKDLQEKKWKYDIEMKRYQAAYQRNGAIDFVWDRDVDIFSEYHKNKMNNIQVQIEEKLVSESDVVCCTLLQSAKKSVVNFKFEYLFVDEATQVDQVTSIIPLIHQPSRMILLGDHKQLDPFIPEILARKHPFSTQSLYLYLISKNIKSVMLRTQFRMHPLISEFPNKMFYDNQIINAEGMEEKTYSKLVGIKTPILFVDVKKGREMKVFGSSYRNDLEADTVITLLNNFMKNNVPGSEVGVITPYFGQKDLLRNKASVLKYDGVRISSVDSFQGSERDYIIFSLVRENREGKFGFLANPNRINVSITRARKGLIIVGNLNSIINSQNEANKYLVEMCKFYKDKKTVVDSSLIIKITKMVKQPVPALKIVMNENNDDDEIEYVSD